MLTLNSSGHETDGFEVASVTVELSSGALDSEYTTLSKLRVAVKLTAFPSRWPVIVSVPSTTGPSGCRVIEPVPENELSHGFSVTL